MPDIFICHASEDKDEVARPLADSLSSSGLDVWYDEYSLKLGDSLRRMIDKGLAESKFGAVIISPSFFAKEWPQSELDGLFAKEIRGHKTILPIWHKIDRDEVLRHSPIMADRLAARTEEGLDQIVRKILDVIKPDTSHLTLSGKTLAVTPGSIRLHSGEWAVNTPLRVTNLSDEPAYSVQIKITLDPPDLDSKSIHVEYDQPTTAIEEPVAFVTISPDGMLHYLVDSHGREALAIVFHTIDPHSTREVQVAGTKKIKSSAKVELWDFKEKPPEVLRKGGKVAFPISAPEDVTSKGIALLIRKR